MNIQICVALGAAAGFLAAPHSSALDAGPEIEEVIVTAQKRDESIKDVPLSISVLTNEEIERAGFQSLKDMAGSFVNLAFLDIGSRSSYNIPVIRGMMSSIVTTQPRIAVLVDDVPHRNTRSAGALFDIQQVEVLRGPQSTLFGLTGEGGIINIKSVAPRTDSWGGRITLEAASDSLYQGSFNASGPVVSERWALGVSGYYEEGDAFIRNVVTGEKFNSKEAWGARMRSMFTPSDALTFDLIYTHNQVSDDFGQVMVPVDVARFNRDFAGIGQFDGSLGEFEAGTDFEGYVDNTVNEGSLRATYSMPQLDVVVVSAYRESNRFQMFDSNATPVRFFGSPGGSNEMPTRELTQELRLVSAPASENPLSWVAGIFYSSFDEDLFQAFFVGNAPISSRTNEGESRAIFADVKYRFANGLGVTAGARYEEAEASGRFDFSVFTPTVNGISAKIDDSVVLPRFIIDYQFENRNLIYASASRGWLPAGVSISPIQQTYDSEIALNYELGAKSAWWDGRLQLTGAVFQTTIDDFQETVRVGPLSFAVDNADEVRIRGAEIEIVAALTSALQLRAGFGINDAQYTRFQNAFENNTGNDLPGPPKHNGNVELTYTFPNGVFASGQWLSSGDFRVLDDRVNRFPEQPGYDVFNLVGGWEGDQWSVHGFVRNLEDKRYITTVFDQVADGRLMGSVGHRRQIGARVIRRF